MHKRDSVLNNLQWLICHEIKPDQTKQGKKHVKITRIKLENIAKMALKANNLFETEC